MGEIDPDPDTVPERDGAGEPDPNEDAVGKGVGEADNNPVVVWVKVALAVPKAESVRAADGVVTPLGVGDGVPLEVGLVVPDGVGDELAVRDGRVVMDMVPPEVGVCAPDAVGVTDDEVVGKGDWVAAAVSEPAALAAGVAVPLPERLADDEPDSVAVWVPLAVSVPLAVAAAEVVANPVALAVPEPEFEFDEAGEVLGGGEADPDLEAEGDRGADPVGLPDADATEEGKPVVLAVGEALAGAVGVGAPDPLAGAEAVGAPLPEGLVVAAPVAEAEVEADAHRALAAGTQPATKSRP